jgi:beta-lactamase regulating signal transducer with metallopeptidase domain
MNIAQMSISAGVLIVVIIIIRALAIDRLPKGMFFVLWVLVLVRLLVPIAIPINISIWKGWNSFRNETLQYNLANTSKDLTQNPVVNPYGIAELAGKQSNNIPVFHIIWLVVALILLFYFLISYVISYRKLQEALPIVNNIWVDKWQQNNGFERKIKVMVSDRISTPITYGIISPKIILPKTMDFSNNKQMEYIFTHEMNHIKRFDNLWKIISLIALCIHWFNPLVWVMFVLFNRDMEISCDEKVLAILGESEKKYYALALINLAEKKANISSLYNGFGRNAIEERIGSIMKYKKSTMFGVGCAVLIIATSTTIFASAADNVKSSDAKKANASSNLLKTKDTTEVAISTVLSMVNNEGVEQYSIDNGETWMSGKEYEAAYPIPDVEWYTYDEYKEFIENEKINLAQMVKDKVKGWNETDGNYIWTQEKADEAIKLYESNLFDIKNGKMISKTVDGNDDLMISYYNSPSEISVTKEDNYIIDLDGEISSYDSYEELLEDVNQQVKDGAITKEDVDKIISDLKK